MSYMRDLNEIGTSAAGRAITHTLYVHEDGSGTDGMTWDTAYTTLKAALDAASTDSSDCTQIFVGPTATYYDMNTTGDPTYSGNYHIVGPHRKWAPLKNTHASANSILKFTGYASISDMAISMQGSVGGLIFTKGGWRVRRCGFNSESTTGATTSVYLDGTSGTIIGGIMEDVEFLGHVSYTTAIYMDTCSVNTIRNVSIHKCINGIQIVNAASDYNEFRDIEIGDCAIGLNLDAGNEQHFNCVHFHDNTTNIDDEVGDHAYAALTDNFDIVSVPADVDGTTVTAHADADTFGADTELRSAAAATKPFRVIGYAFQPAITQNHLVRFSDDSGSTFFDYVHVGSTKTMAGSAPSGTEHIFNVGTRISCSIMAETGGSDTVQVWLIIQEI